MKNLLFLLAILLAAPVAHAQKAKEDIPSALPISPETHLVDYTGVVDVPGTTQSQLYSRAYEWIAKYYNSANSVIQMQDKETGKIIVKGRSKAYFKDFEFGWINHTLSIYVKDGKYKYDITDFSHQGTTYSYGNLEQDEPHYIPGAFKGRARVAWDGMKRSTDKEMKALAASLNAAMTTKAASDF